MESASAVFKLMMKERQMAKRRKYDQQSGGWSSNSGIGVDKYGGPTIDPTANVLALNAASTKRIDDMAEIREALADEKIKRIEERAVLLDTIVKLRAEHQAQLDSQESKRLDAVRAVDQLTVKTEADRQAAAVTTLATQAATTAETLRSAVNSSATNLATQLATTIATITERIATLEKSSYTGQGKQAAVDPQVSEMLTELRALRQTQSTAGGRTEGMTTSWKFVVAGIGMFGTLITIGSVAVAVVVFLNK